MTSPQYDLNNYKFLSNPLEVIELFSNPLVENNEKRDFFSIPLKEQIHNYDSSGYSLRDRKQEKVERGEEEISKIRGKLSDDISAYKQQHLLSPVVSDCPKCKEKNGNKIEMKPSLLVGKKGSITSLVCPCCQYRILP